MDANQMLLHMLVRNEVVLAQNRAILNHFYNLEDLLAKSIDQYKCEIKYNFNSQITDIQEIESITKKYLIEGLKLPEDQIEKIISELKSLHSIM